MAEQHDIIVVGAGAAGLFAAIWAGRTLRERGVRDASVLALDGARTLGAKILVAGGGRCNVTHHAVDEHQYAGGSRHAIRNVLTRFGVDRTVGFFQDLGVELKREDTGKLFPFTDDARTVLDALLRACAEAGVRLRHPARVRSITRDADGFEISADAPPAQPGESAAGVATNVLRARRVVLATGGMALPRSGSDGVGYQFARALGHTLTPGIFPALVPMLLPKGHWMCSLSGVAVPATVGLRSGSGKHIVEFTNAVLFTHFGLSGPGILDVSRHWTAARAEDPDVSLVLNLAPGVRHADLDRLLIDARGVGLTRWLCEQTPIRTPVPGHGPQGLPERVARAVCAAAGVDPATLVHALTRDQRRAVVDHVCGLSAPVTGDRGFTFAEVTAGGVPLSEVNLKTMESRVCPGLHLCGELLDVDGRIGGFNFQWAWASGFVAGTGVAGHAGT